jgi:8-oxo-dGTP diphosphatase
MTIGHFLGGIAALIWDPATEKYLILRRAAERDFQAGAWECVTGRVDQGESYEQALHREIQEEIGAQVRIEFLIGTTHFYRGEAVPENELLGVIYGCTIQSSINILFGVEHSEKRWVSFDEIKTMLPEGNWLRKVMSRSERLKKMLPSELRKALRDEGFEI